jgi:hypothetical protein
MPYGAGLLRYDNDPWYHPESKGLWKLLERAQVAVGLARPEDFPGPQFQSDGYRLEELGPKALSKCMSSLIFYIEGN